MQGTHLILNAGGETIEVHLGPFAREIHKDQTVWTLRDAYGRPLWARAYHR